LDIILVGNFQKRVESELSDRLKVFNSQWLLPLSASTPHFPGMVGHETLWDAVSAKFSSVTKDQSMAIIYELKRLGVWEPALATVEVDKESLATVDSDIQKPLTERLANPRTGEEKIHSLVKSFVSGDNERIFDIPEWLRKRGHYIPTEDDLAEYMSAKDTYARVAVLDRLNHEKREMEERFGL
jgi:hypothetical protein